MSQIKIRKSFMAVMLMILAAGLTLSYSDKFWENTLVLDDDISFTRPHRMSDEPIQVTSLCDARLSDLEEHSLRPNIFCTLKQCPKKTPCCNDCGISGWIVQGTQFLIQETPASLGSCQVNGCGRVAECPPEIVLKDLRKTNCSK